MCSQPPDVVFLLDSSGSLSFQNFLQLKELTKNIVNSLDVGPTGTAVGAVRFSTDANVMFNLREHTTPSDVNQAIDNIAYVRGTTNTHSALKLARSIFTPGNGDRLGNSNFIVLITDGSSDNNTAMLDEARTTLSEGIHIIVVTVTNWVDFVAMYTVASYPSDANVFNMERFDPNVPAFGKLIQTLCNGKYIESFEMTCIRFNK